MELSEQLKVRIIHAILEHAANQKIVQHFPLFQFKSYQVNARVELISVELSQKSAVVQHHSI
jgi:hypothetical protein